MNNKVRMFLTTALKIWAEQGFNQKLQCFEEALDFKGNKLNLDRRFRVQARQIYVYSFAFNNKLINSKGLEIAKQAYDFIWKNYWHSEGGWIYSITPNLQAKNTTRYFYEQTFFLLAATQLFIATNNQNYLTDIDKTWNFIINKLKSNLGFYSSTIDKQERLQNPHMHLFEALLSIYQCTHDNKWLKEINDLYQLFTIYFYDHKEKVLKEYFDENLKPQINKSNLVEPGHQAEWTWLLFQYNKITNPQHKEITKLIIHHLYNFTTTYGIDNNGLGFDQVNNLTKEKKSSKRLWVQTEILKAHLAMLEIKPNDYLKKQANNLIENIFNFYLLHKKGIWYDQIDIRNENISIKSTASSFYHLILSFVEYLRIF